MFTSKKKEKPTLQFVSPNITPQKFSDEIKKLEKKGVNPPSRSDSLLIENPEVLSPIIYQKEKKIGEGSWGHVFLFSEITKKNKPAKVVKEIKEMILFKNLLPGLIEELKKTRERTPCNYENLLAALDQLGQDGDMEFIKENMRKPEAIESDFEDFIPLIESIIEKHNDLLTREYSLIQEVYGEADLFLEDSRVSMAFLPGKTLHEKLKKPLSFINALDLLYDIFNTYKVLHEAYNIAQIDITTNNMLIDENGYILLCDFGFARKFGTYYNFTHFNSEDSSHFAPEIREGVTIDHRIDVYALGLILENIVNAIENISSIKTITPSPIKNEINDQARVFIALKEIESKMRIYDPTKRTITLTEINENLLYLRSKYFPKADKFSPKLYPTFQEKMKELKQSEEVKQTRSLRS